MMEEASTREILIAAASGEAILLLVIAGLVRRYLRTRVVHILYLILPSAAIGLAVAAAMLFVYEADGDLAAPVPWPYQTVWVAGASLFHLGIKHFDLQVFHRGETLPWILSGALAIAWGIVWWVFPILRGVDAGLYDAQAEAFPVGTTATALIWIIWGWGGYNCFRFWRVYRQDIARGKERNPVIVHRFFLWGVGIIAVFIAQVIGPLFVTPGGASPPPIVLAVFVLLYFAAGATAYLGWAPPRWYQHKVLGVAA